LTTVQIPLIFAATTRIPRRFHFLQPEIWEVKSIIVRILATLVLTLLPALGHTQPLHPSKEEDSHDTPFWVLHFESETEVAFEHEGALVSETLTAEADWRLWHSRLYLGVAAIVNFEEMPHVGGGVVLRYRSPRLSLLGRIMYDHGGFERGAEEQNALRAEARGTVWVHHYLGVTVQGLIEHYFEAINFVRANESHSACGLGLAARVNDHLGFAVLGTLRFRDFLNARREADHDVLPGVTFVAAFGFH
jgi:hypothetical protein